MGNSKFVIEIVSQGVVGGCQDIIGTFTLSAVTSMDKVIWTAGSSTVGVLQASDRISVDVIDQVFTVLDTNIDGAGLTFRVDAELITADFSGSYSLVVNQLTLSLHHWLGKMLTVMIYSLMPLSWLMLVCCLQLLVHQVEFSTMV